MTKFEVLSKPVEYQFPGRLFEIMPEDHFWVRSRFNVFTQEVRKLGINLTDRKVGFDIGCAHGVVQRQLATHSSWSADGCDLEIAGLEQNSGHNGRVFYYDIKDRRSELCNYYDFLIIFDVLEHIDNPGSFLDNALFHLKPGGYIFVNVPAIPALHSKFDDVLGHVRRYDREHLLRHLAAAGLHVLSIRYWGATMIPVIYLRARLVNFFTDAEKILDLGFKPPGRLMAAALSRLLSVETWAFRSPPIGTCLFAVAQKVDSAHTS